MLSMMQCRRGGTTSSECIGWIAIMLRLGLCWWHVIQRYLCICSYLASQIPDEAVVLG
jgi:hypothetical protein